MNETRIVMGMPISVIIPSCPMCGSGNQAAHVAPEEPNVIGFPGGAADADCIHVRKAIDAAFAYFESVDRQFSPFKLESEVSAIRSGEVTQETASEEMRTVLRLCEETKWMTEGFFDAWAGGVFDPSGLVKGWSLHNAARQLDRAGFTVYSIDGAGDIEVKGLLAGREPWRVGIRNPFDPRTIIKVLSLSDCGIATSGNYIRGEHIYNPFTREKANAVASITVIAPNVYEADRLATAAFAMGPEGIAFLASLRGIEAYLVDASAEATYTPGFERYIAS